MLFWDARYLHNQHGLNEDCWMSLQVVTLQRRLPSQVAYFEVERMAGNLANVRGNFAVLLFLVVILVTVHGKEGMS